MSDVEFMDAVESGDGSNVVIGQSVPHVQHQALRDSVQAGFAEAIQFGGASSRSASLGPRSGVQLHCGDVEFHGFADLLNIGVDEQADEDSSPGQLCRALTDPLSVRNNVESAFRGDFFPAFRYEGGLIGEGLQGDAGNFVRDGHFQIESESDGFAEEANVAVLNVPPVFAQVNCDGVCSAQFGQNGSLYRVRFGGTSGLADGGNVIDVYAEQGHDLNTPGDSLCRLETDLWVSSLTACWIVQKVGNAGKLELGSLSETGGDAGARPPSGIGMFFAVGNLKTLDCRSGTLVDGIVWDRVFLRFFKRFVVLLRGDLAGSVE